jgi:superfamily I DNA and/or RNA helicase/very-short-patch-repair endonuclease
MLKKDKYLQIFNYLLEFSKLRSVPVRNIENSNQYSEILWLKDIPQNELFESVTFSNYNNESEFWLKIYKPQNEPKKPLFSKLNPVFAKWVKEESLIKDIEIPILYSQLNINGEILYIDDFPEVKESFEDYVAHGWKEDLLNYTASIKDFEKQQEVYEKLSKTYKQLFSFYNKSQQFGEEFELIMGAGLLVQQDTQKTQICRHILTSKVDISFEFSNKDSYVLVSPSIESEIQIETDSIIDLVDQFDSNDIIDAERKMTDFIKNNEISYDLFDDKIKDALQIFADRFSSEGKFIDDLNKPNSNIVNPIIQFCPALILRKRNTRSLSALYETIINDITVSDESLNINSINDIIGVLDDNDLEDSESDKNWNDDNIYFPKKYNEEQVEIVEKIRRNSKVLVQGPPGTGKSHTIANLICHLLANGKRVLVTAYTTRALEVLKNQLPVEFQSLAVNLLSSDNNSIQDLDKSVNAINDELSTNSDLNQLKGQIEKIGIDIISIKKKIALTKNEWLSVKESSTRLQILNEEYQGHLTDLAEKLEKDIQRFSWFTDKVSDSGKIELIDKIEDFYKDTIIYTKEKTDNFRYEFLNINELINDETFEKYITFFKEFEKIEIRNDSNFTLKLNDVSNVGFENVYNKIIELKEVCLSIEYSKFQYKDELIFNENDCIGLWKNRISKVRNIISACSIEKLDYFDRNYEILYPLDKNYKKINYDANILIDYLNEGNTLSGILFNFKKSFLPDSIKEKIYFTKEITVNGAVCNNLELIKCVIDDIKIKQDFIELSNILGKTELTSYTEKHFYYSQTVANAEILISLIDKFIQLKSEIELISNIDIISFSTDQFDKLLFQIEFAKKYSIYKGFKEELLHLKKKIQVHNLHPFYGKLLNSIDNQDTVFFTNYYKKIVDLIIERNKYFNYLTNKKTLELVFPLLVDSISNFNFDVDQLSQIKGAILFYNALSKLNNIIDNDSETKKLNELIELEIKHQQLVTEVASKKAWYSVIDTLNDNPLIKRHLQAWVLAVKKIGKTGIGKRAIKFRKEAQIQMEKCKNSVPCWIMPLYKVAETIKPEREMYDYVIIDEASQLGADAIFLLYISKNIIIVGDDKQTSPEYVGVDSNSMTPHINRFLNNIPFKNYYGTEFSFFDHARMLCNNGMVVLREHFRCMPEIIEFCNKNFYLPDGKGLYPLKQYSENRLQPLVSVYTNDGYIDGSYANITNIVEAEAISSKIAEIISKDEYFTYDGESKKPKTIGVIALQGNRQADIIDKLILKKIGEKEYKLRKIICGNSASFQGDERDIIFLSLITANNHRRQSLTSDNDKRRFNVAVSRAKEQLWLFHSVILDDLSSQDDLRYKLLDHFLNYKPQSIPLSHKLERTIGSQPEPFDSWFEVDVYNDIISKGYGVIPQYEVARGKYRIDLVILLPNGIKIAVECDGDKFHGADHFENDMMRQKVLERCGWQFFRVRGAEYYTNRVKSLEHLWVILEKNYPKSNIIKRERDIIDILKVSDTNTDSTPIISNSIQNTLFDTAEIKTPKVTNNIFSYKEFLIFTNYYNLYKVQNKGYDNHSDILSNIEFYNGEKSIYITGTNTYEGFMLFGFDNGKVAKIPLSTYVTTSNRKKLMNAYSSMNKLIFIESFNEEIDLVAISSIKKIVIFNTDQLLPISRSSAAGVKVMHLKNNSNLSSIKKLSKVKFQNPDYYRKDGLNVIGYYLKDGDFL